MAARSPRDLLRRKRELEALYPLLTIEQQEKAREEIEAIARKLKKFLRQNDASKFVRDVPASAVGINGVGGLDFTVNAPPGQGRLVRLPFYLYEGEPDQCSFVQEYYSAVNVKQVETLTITDGGTGGPHSVVITLGGVAAPPIVIAVGAAPSVIAATIAAVDFSGVGLGWNAFNPPGSPDVIFTCVQFGYVSGAFSLVDTLGGLIAGTFSRTQAGRTGRSEVRLVGIAAPTAGLVPVIVGLGPALFGPYLVNCPGGFSFASWAAARDDLFNQLNLDAGFLASWSVVKQAIPFPPSGLYPNTTVPGLRFTSVAFAPVPGPALYGITSPTVSAYPPLGDNGFVRLQAGILPRPEIRTLTITDFGSPGPDTVDVTLDGVLYAGIAVNAGVSNAQIAADIAAAAGPPWVGSWVAANVPGSPDVVFTSVTNAPLTGTYSLAWTGGTPILGTFVETVPGAVAEWIAANQPLWVTGNGPNVPDESRSNVLVTIPNDPDCTVVRGFKFRTPQIEWARLRIVGFRVTTKPVPRGEYPNPPLFASVWPNLPISEPVARQGLDYSGGFVGPVLVPLTSVTGLPMSQLGYAAYWRGSAPVLLVKNLNVGGGANLFIQDGYIDTISYSNMVDEFAGLRAYPMLESPNRAFIEAAVSGSPLTGLGFTMELVCEVIEDLDYGSPIPGPYARRDAMMRYDPPNGQGFVR